MQGKEKSCYVNTIRTTFLAEIKRNCKCKEVGKWVPVVGQNSSWYKYKRAMDDLSIKTRNIILIVRHDCLHERHTYKGWCWS